MIASVGTSYLHFIPRLREQIEGLPDGMRSEIDRTLFDLERRLDSLRPDYEPPPAPWSPEFWANFKCDEECCGDGIC